MESKRFDFLCVYEDGKWIYKCTVDGTTKLAKYEGMKVWLIKGTRGDRNVGYIGKHTLDI